MFSLKTIRMPWLNIGTIDTSTANSDVALGVTERDFATNKSLANVVWKEVPAGINVLETRFSLTTNGVNEILDVWAGRLNSVKKDKIGLIRVCTLDVEAGTQKAADSALLLADEIIITNNDWIKTVSTIQSGNDSEFVARLIFDLCGYDLILYHGHTTATEDCVIEISGF